MNRAESPAPSRSPQRQFMTTHWSVVMEASMQDSKLARQALEQLCQRYWYPIYAFVRREGYTAHDAEDLTQSFFQRLLEGRWVERADPEKGRFRSFLLTLLKRHMIGEWRRSRSFKRSGCSSGVQVPLENAESRFLAESAVTMTAEWSYDYQWATTLLSSVLSDLKRAYTAQGQARLFESLKSCLMGTRETLPYERLGKELDMQIGAVKVAVHRLRERYRRGLRAAVAETVVREQDVEDEMRYLVRVLSDPSFDAPL